MLSKKNSDFNMVFSQIQSCFPHPNHFTPPMRRSLLLVTLRERRMGGADVAPGVHGILVNGKQPTFEGGGPRFARPAVVECEEAIVVGPGAVVFVQASDG